MKPSDRAAIEGRLHDMDAEGAARELALVLHLDRDAENLIAWAIEESYKNGKCDGISEMGGYWNEEAHA